VNRGSSSKPKPTGIVVVTVVTVPGKLQVSVVVTGVGAVLVHVQGALQGTDDSVVCNEVQTVEYVEVYQEVCPSSSLAAILGVRASTPPTKTMMAKSAFMVPIFFVKRLAERCGTAQYSLTTKFCAKALRIRAMSRV